jgi:hypothetical protein
MHERLPFDTSKFSSMRYWLGEERYQRNLDFFKPLAAKKKGQMIKELWLREEPGNIFPARRLAKAAAPGNVFGIFFRALKA